MKKGYIYMISNKKNGTIYIGVTSNIRKRVYQHKNKLIDGFTKKYNLTNLVYYEECSNIIDAINREKQLKGGNRKTKIELIEEINKNWEDLPMHLN